MKEFKKWNLKQSNDVLQNNHRLYAYIDEERGRAWKAALGWAISKGFMDDYCDEYIPTDVVRNELEE